MKEFDLEYVGINGYVFVRIEKCVTRLFADRVKTEKTSCPELLCRLIKTYCGFTNATEMSNVQTDKDNTEQSTTTITGRGFDKKPRKKRKCLKKTEIAEIIKGRKTLELRVPVLAKKFAVSTASIYKILRDAEK